MTLQEIHQQTHLQPTPFSAQVFIQITHLKVQNTKAGKPYLEIEIADSTGHEKIKIWQDTHAYSTVESMAVGSCWEIHGYFHRNSFGLNIDQLEFRALSEEEKKTLFAGSPEYQQALEHDFQTIISFVAQIKDPRLRLVCEAFLEQYGERFRRAGAARDYHHARRGGLLQHTAQMMRSAKALQSAYPQLNGDLVLAGVLFHDCGKLWENDYAAEAFHSPISLVGELLGHISIGIELVNRIWRGLENRPEFLEEGNPVREVVREHLLHLIASHHGQKEFGAPVTPRTPEAWALHYIDNLDARLEMLKQTYAEKPLVAPGIYDFRRPLEGHAVAPLAHWQAK